MAGTEPMIRLANSSEDYAAFGRLCRDYVAWCRDQYRDLPWFFEAVFGHQSFDEELGRLEVKYGPPEGRVLIAVLNGEAVAGVACRRLSDEVCELKRLYVADGARGFGVGRALTTAMMAQAREDGFTAMLLDTADRLTTAITLYESMGFERIGPYQAYPETLLPYLVFMSRRL
jgi:GNAT superfamily N-acetyltransferase